MGKPIWCSDITLEKREKGRRLEKVLYNFCAVGVTEEECLALLRERKTVIGFANSMLAKGWAYKKVILKRQIGEVNED